MECVHFAIIYSRRNAHTRTDQSHRQSTQKYHCWHEVKSTDQVLDFRDVYRIESRKCTKCVQLAIIDVQYVKYLHSHCTETHLNHIASQWNTEV